MADLDTRCGNSTLISGIIIYFELAKHVDLFVIIPHSDNVKKSIANHLLAMHQDPKWQTKLSEFHVTKFTETAVEMYEEDEELKKEVKGMSMNKQVYY